MTAEVHEVREAVSEPERHRLIIEADRQTQAIMRLEVYKRLGYTGVAAGALLVYWHVYLGGAGWLQIVGIVLLSIMGIASILLTVGIANAKKNVKALMMAAGVNLDAVPLGDGRDSKIVDIIRRANVKADSFMKHHAHGTGKER